MAKTACVGIEVLVLGPIDNNVYIIDDGTSRIVVDPTCDAKRIVETLGERKLDAIVLTHAHWDHVGGAKELRELTGAPVCASVVDAPVIEGKKDLDPGHRQFDPCLVDRLLSEDDMLEVGKMKWRVIETPGHTPGSISLFLDAQYGSDPEGAPVLISGDTLFAGTHGRTDFVGGSMSDMRNSLVKLSKLPLDTIVLPGHNNLTIIEREIGWLRLCGM